MSPPLSANRILVDKNKIVILNIKFEWSKPLSQARAPLAEAISYSKQRAMSRALNLLFCDVEELVRLPVEINAGVRAVVFIGVKLIAVVDDEELEGFLSNA